MIHIREVIVVEGRYDKAALANAVDGICVDTAGFGIFSDREKLRLLRRLAAARGLVILTDSDGGGFLIRHFLKGAIDPHQVKHAYIPDVYGKEKRKKAPSKEGKLGVEGMRPEILEQALRRAGVTLLVDDNSVESPSPITKADLYTMGLVGQPNSSRRRAALQKALDLPEHLASNALLDVVNALMTREELAEILASLPA